MLNNCSVISTEEQCVNQKKKKKDIPRYLWSGWEIKNYLRKSIRKSSHDLMKREYFLIETVVCSVVFFSNIFCEEGEGSWREASPGYSVEDAELCRLSKTGDAVGDTRDTGVTGTCPGTTRFQVIFRSQKRMSRRLQTLGGTSADLSGVSALALRGQLRSEWLRWGPH